MSNNIIQLCKNNNELLKLYKKNPNEPLPLPKNDQEKLDNILSGKELPPMSSEIVIDNSEMIDSLKYQNNSTLKQIIMPNIKFLPTFAFSNCPNLEVFSMPNLVHIASDPFSNCKNLKEINLPSYVGSSTPYFYGISINNFRSLEYVDLSSVEGDFVEFQNVTSNILILSKLENLGSSLEINHLVLRQPNVVRLRTFSSEVRAYNKTDLHIPAKVYVKKELIPYYQKDMTWNKSFELKNVIFLPLEDFDFEEAKKDVKLFKK